MSGEHTTAALEPLPEGIPDAAVEAFYDEVGIATYEAVRAGLSGWARERYTVTRGLAAALRHIGCAGLYDGAEGQCPCFRAGYLAGHDDGRFDCNCRDPNG